MLKKVQRLSDQAGAAFFIARTLRAAAATVKRYEPFVCRAAKTYEKRGARYAEQSRNICDLNNVVCESDTEQGGA